MNPDNRSIGELAYRLWQSRGCPDGSAEEDWREAERQLTGDKIPVAVAATQSTTPTRERATRSRGPRSKPRASDVSGDLPS